MARYLLLGLTLILSACAQQKIILNHSDMVPLKQFSESLATTTRVKGALTVLSFKDQRNKTSVGTAVTGLSNVDTPIYLDLSTEDYVKKRFVSGLAKRGVDVVSGSKYVVRGNIKKLWVWEKADGWRPEHSNCEIEIDFDIISLNRENLKYHGTVFSNAMGTDSIIDTTESNGAVLEACMSFVIEKFVQNPELQKFLGFEVLK